MEKLCNILSEIHLRFAVTLSVSTPTTKHLSCRIDSGERFASIGCWFNVFPRTFPAWRRMEMQFLCSILNCRQFHAPATDAEKLKISSRWWKSGKTFGKTVNIEKISRVPVVQWFMQFPMNFSSKTRKNFSRTFSKTCNEERIFWVFRIVDKLKISSILRQTEKFQHLKHK